jgi:hypothetical protein
MILSLITMRVTRSGRFKTGGDLDSALLDTGTLEAGAELGASIMAGNTPVVSGLGRDSWQVEGGAHFSGHTLVARFSNTAQNRGVYYIPIANVRSKRNAGFIQRGLAQAKERVPAAMKARIAGLGSRLWTVKA